MEKNLHLDFKPQDEMSDTLSTSASLANIPCEETSPSNVNSTNSIEEESVCKSKKIRKKRNAYQKIDDDIRLHLLEAVQRGETLKSAAKRFNVNYSSAKSIFHIYRKEGRILKKATQEKGFGFDYPNQPEGEMQSQFVPNPNPTRLNSPYQRPLFSQVAQPLDLKSAMFHNIEGGGSGSSSPLNNLVDNFADLLRIGNNQPTNNNQQRMREDMMRNKAHMPIQPSRFNPLSSPTHSMFKMQQNPQMTQPNQFSQISQFSQLNQMNHQMNQTGQMSPLHQYNMHMNQINQLNQLNQMAQITLASKPQNGLSPAERMKQFDNFYMNYSNSPLSGNAGSKMVREGSESGSNRYQQKEFESFTEMVSALQTNNHLTDNLQKNDVSIPKLHVPLNQMQQPAQDRFEVKMDEDTNLNGTIESAAFDTFKSFLDAQKLLSNAYKKASLLNNLVQRKNSGSPSPKFLNFQN